jgi:hypothetical protein
VAQRLEQGEAQVGLVARGGGLREFPDGDLLGATPPLVVEEGAQQGLLGVRVRVVDPPPLQVDLGERDLGQVLGEMPVAPPL